MKTLYIDCGMGAAGDMLAAALLELVDDPDRIIEKINALGIPGVKVDREKNVKCGITGTGFRVLVNGQEESVQDVDIHAGDHAHEHEHDQNAEGHKHDHSHDAEPHEHVHTHIDENGNEYTHSHSHEHEHSHAHTHDHSHENHSHDHCHADHAHTHSHAHAHNNMESIKHIVSRFELPEKVKADILAVYGLIAEAESHAHGRPVEEIHFHEVGTMDAIADVTSVCLLMNEINPDRIIASPVHVGSGNVKCAHGILPVPAPATAYILRDVPIYGGSSKAELCTPTGAALLKYFVNEFGNMPVMKTEKIGYGMGKKEFEVANCVRAMLGETADATGVVYELTCNVDDMTAEQIGFAMDVLLESGAHEVYTLPAGMKKNRPGTVLCTMCPADKKDELVSLIFKHTTTIGIRENVSKRYILNRSFETVHTEFGEVRCKISEGYGVTKKKYEYDDLARIAKEQNMSIDQVKDLLD